MNPIKNKNELIFTSGKDYCLLASKSQLVFISLSVAQAFSMEVFREARILERKGENSFFLFLEMKIILIKQTRRNIDFKITRDKNKKRPLMK